MTRFLIHRPIAVLMVTLALGVFSTLALLQLPISLLPPVDVPVMLIRAEAPDQSPVMIEENILRPVRDNLLTLPGLTGLESEAAGETGIISLRFSYQTNMNLAYIEVNERIDRLLSLLPPGLERPRVMRLSTADIPVIRLQVVPRDSSHYLAVSELAEKVLRRRIEQLPGVSMVHITGIRKREIAVTPLPGKLAAYGLSPRHIIDAISSSNADWGAIRVKDGQYRYAVKVASRLTTPAQIGKLPIAADGRQPVRVQDVARVEEARQPITGLHLFNNREGLSIIIFKQSQARMMPLIEAVKEATDRFRAEYPQATFTLTRDQSALLQAGIANLRTALLYGGVFAFAVLFLFLNHPRLALIMGISLPVSLLLSFLIFYLTGLSINIISLSGLALGLGMLIDNAIIVLDNISARRQQGLPLTEACVQGVREVAAPLISSVLTTLAVFVPLVYLHGMAGALFYDQAVAVAAILSVSLLVSFALLPLLYRLFMPQQPGGATGSRLFALITRLYNRLFALAWNRKGLTLTLIAVFCLAGIWLGLSTPHSLLPATTRHDYLLQINWNEPLSLTANRQRIGTLTGRFRPYTRLTEADVGQPGTTASATSLSRDRAEVYFLLADSVDATAFSRQLSRWLGRHYPLATFILQPAPNAFDQIFADNRPYFQARLRPRDSLLTPAQVDRLLDPDLRPQKYGRGFSAETIVWLRLDERLLALSGIDRQELLQQLAQLFGHTPVTEIKRFGSQLRISLPALPQAHRQLDAIFITNTRGVSYPLSHFVKITYATDSKFITADEKGLYQDIRYGPEARPDQLVPRLQSRLAAAGILSDFRGRYFTTRQNLQQLGLVLLVSFALLYFILAAQFESFRQPLIVIATLPLGIGGSLLFLYLAGYSLNLMSGIGIIIMLGIMINDAILKLDTLNRQLRQTPAAPDSKTCYRLIHQAGLLRLRPIMMTTLTTILALAPILPASGLGAELQKSLVIAVMGGLVVGTVTAVFFVPLLYYYLVAGRATGPDS